MGKFRHGGNITLSWSFAVRFYLVLSDLLLSDMLTHSFFDSILFRHPVVIDSLLDGYSVNKESARTRMFFIFKVFVGLWVVVALCLALLS